MSPLRKVRIIRKWKILDEIFIFRTSVMPEHQGVEKNGNIAKRDVSRYYDFLEWTQASYYTAIVIHNILNSVYFIRSIVYDSQ
ncbi:MAG: hypothetical protein ACI9FN_000607 [Saprospiraceae bacterium]|jgi:hypothetical protein